MLAGSQAAANMVATLDASAVAVTVGGEAIAASGIETPTVAEIPPQDCSGIFSQCTSACKKTYKVTVVHSGAASSVVLIATNAKPNVAMPALTAYYSRGSTKLATSRLNDDAVCLLQVLAKGALHRAARTLPNASMVRRSPVTMAKAIAPHLTLLRKLLAACVQPLAQWPLPWQFYSRCGDGLLHQPNAPSQHCGQERASGQATA